MTDIGAFCRMAFQCRSIACENVIYASEEEDLRELVKTLESKVKEDTYDEEAIQIGDYTGLSLASNLAHSLWMDMRNPDLFLCPGTGVPGVPPKLCISKSIDGMTSNDQDIFSQAVTVP